MPTGPVEVIYGPITVGIFLNLILYGIMITQTHYYFQTFKEDKPWIKKLVAFIFVADTLNTAFDAAFLYKRLVQSFGNVDEVMVADWVFNTDPAMTCIIALAVQLFFSWRIKVLTKNNALFGVVAFCSAVQFFAGLATAVACSIVTQFTEFRKFKVVVILWLAFSAIADVLIAVVLTWHLRKRKTGFAFTDDLINRLTRLTVQTGAITAVFAIIDLVTFLISNSGLHLAFNFPLAKLYTNSLLSTLNARARAGASSDGPSSGHHDMPQLPARREEISVQVLTQTHRDDDTSSRFDSTKNSPHDLDRPCSDTKVYINVEDIQHRV